MGSGHHPPAIPDLPKPPRWDLGLCTTVPQRMRLWWTSEDRNEKQAARRMCQGCPVLAGCESWAMGIAYADSTVYAAMTSRQRRKRRHALLRQIAADVRG